MFIPGIIIVFLCTFGGYIALGGNMTIIIKAAPFELVIILGTGIGAYIIGNSKKILNNVNGALRKMLAGPSYSKADYLDLLCLMFMIFKLAKTKGMLTLEAHVENPKESKIFTNFPKLLRDHHIIDFLCDYLRMMTMGTENAMHIEDLMTAEIEVHHQEDHQLAGSIQTLADALPALGIVAAVLGVIKTMAAIDQPPEILGKMIGAALVGTFLGVFLAYGAVGPIASNLNLIYEEDSKMFEAIKVGFVAFLNGHAPAVSIEFARKALMSHQRPGFYEVEEETQSLPSIT